MCFANDPMFELSRAKNAIIKQQICLLEMIFLRKLYANPRLSILIWIIQCMGMI